MYQSKLSDCMTIAEAARIVGVAQNTSRAWADAGKVNTSSGTATGEIERVFRCFKCGRSRNALDLWAMATKQPPYEAAVGLCGQLHLPVPYSPMSDANGDREEEPVPGLSTSPVQ